jgi:hypothetical protein
MDFFGLGASAGLAGEADGLDPFAAYDGGAVCVLTSGTVARGADGAEALGALGEAGTAASPGTAAPPVADD